MSLMSDVSVKITSMLKVNGNISMGRKVRGKVIRSVREKCFTDGPRRAQWSSSEDRLWAITVHLFQPGLPSVRDDSVMELAGFVVSYCLWLSSFLPPVSLSLLLLSTSISLLPAVFSLSFSRHRYLFILQVQWIYSISHFCPYTVKKKERKGIQERFKIIQSVFHVELTRNTSEMWRKQDNKSINNS